MKDIEKAFESKSYTNSWSFVFEEYHDLIDIFERQHVDKLFSHQEKYNIEIKLKLEKTLNFKFLYSMSWKELQVLCKYLDEQLTKKFIWSNCFSFISFMLFVKKSEKELHFCINYQALNTIIIWNQYLIFLIQKILNQFLKAQYFIKLDIIHMFNQIYIHENNEKYIAF